jgi:hypothetical protein
MAKRVLMRLFLLLLCLWMPGAVMAELGSLMLRPQGPQPPAEAGRPGSLFTGAAKGSFLAPFPARTVPARVAAPPPRAGYDAVQHGARIKPRKRPTDMIISEIYD